MAYGLVNRPRSRPSIETERLKQSWHFCKKYLPGLRPCCASAATQLKTETSKMCSVDVNGAGPPPENLLRWPFGNLVLQGKPPLSGTEIYRMATSE